MVVPIHLEKAGAKWWRIENNPPNLSKASLGRFMECVLRNGAHIGQVWPFAPKYPRSSVYFMLYMTDDMRIKIEDELGILFSPPENPRPA